MKTPEGLFVLQLLGWRWDRIEVRVVDSERVKRPRAGFQVALRSSVMGAVRFEA